MYEFDIFLAIKYVVYIKLCRLTIFIMTLHRFLKTHFR